MLDGGDGLTQDLEELGGGHVHPREPRSVCAWMYGSRSVGLEDPGIPAVALLLEAVDVDG